MARAGAAAGATTRRAQRLPLFALLAANAISGIGNRLTGIAVPWFVLETTGSAAKTGLVGFFTTVPVVLSAVFGGALVDRFGFKRMSIVSDLASGVTVALIPLLHHTTGLAFWQLLALVFLGAVLDTPGATARQSMFPDIVALGAVRLERANAASMLIWRLSALLGPPLSGVLIAVLGTSNVLWVDAASFAVSALGIALLVPSPSRATEIPPPFTLRRYLDDVAAGFRYIWRDRTIRLIGITGTFGNALGAAVFAVILPVYVVETSGNATDLGLIFSGFGGGAMLGVLVLGAIGHRLPRRATLCAGLLLGAIPYWLLATTPPLWLSVAAMVVLGVAFGPFGPIVMSFYQRRVPVELRGRFFGASLAFDNATAPLLILLTGLLLGYVSLTTGLVLVAAGNLLLTLYVIANPALKVLDEGTGDEPTSQPVGGAP